MVLPCSAPAHRSSRLPPQTGSLHNAGAAYTARRTPFVSPLADPKDRALFHATTGAAACDMESHIAARVASTHNLPFAICRVVLNPAYRTPPPAALISLKQGAPDLRAILRSVVGQPHQLRDLLRLTIDASAAITALRQARLSAGVNLAFSEVPERSPA